MPRKTDEERKRLFEDIGTLFDARAKTLEVNINAHTDAVVRASEDRTNAKIKSLATKDDIKNMATKDDIKNMATKDDIKNMATKDDIKNMATKDDIKNMATKDDIKRLEDKLDETKILRKQVDELRSRLDKVEVDLQRVRARN